MRKEYKDDAWEDWEERQQQIDQLFRSPNQFDMKGELQWRIPGLLPCGYLAMLAGNPKCGKTAFATALALSVAAGVSFAGFPTNQCAVLWISAEESPDERRILLQQNPLFSEAIPIYTCYNNLSIDDEWSLLAIDQWRNEVKAGILVVDPLYGAITPRSLADAANARKALQALKRYCAESSMTALVLHHAKLPGRGEKFGRVAESAQLSAVASMAMVLDSRPCKDQDGKPTRLVAIHAQGRGAFANRTFFFTSSGPMNYALTEEPPPPAPLTRQHREPIAEEKILEMLKDGPADINLLLDPLGRSPGTIRNVLTSLRRKKRVVFVKREGQGTLVALVAHRSAAMKKRSKDQVQKNSRET